MLSLSRRPIKASEIAIVAETGITRLARVMLAPKTYQSHSVKCDWS